MSPTLSPAPRDHGLGLRLRRQGTAFTFDLLGEATVTHAEGQAYEDRCDVAMQELASASGRWPERPLLERNWLVRAGGPERGRERDGLAS
jgi:hypothetical protein